MAHRFRARRRFAPLNIRLGGAATSSSLFFGVRASELNDTWNVLRDLEAIKKIAEGDPESYLVYWKDRQRTLTGTDPQRALLQGYASQAEAKLKDQKEDGAAIARYARTNDHQGYLEYVLGKLERVTDQTTRAKLISQVDELRQRVFRTSQGSAVVGGGVTAEDLVSARDSWSDAKQSAKDKLRFGRPLSDKDISDLFKSGKKLSQLLQRIELDPGLKLSVRQTARTERTSENGPEDYFIVALVQNDSNLVSQGKFDSDGEQAFARQVAAAASLSEQGKMWADRAVVGDLVLNGLRTDTAKLDMASRIDSAEANAQRAARQLAATSKTLPKEAQETLDQLYFTYRTAQIALDESPVSVAEFQRAARQAPDIQSFATALKFGGELTDEWFRLARSAATARRGAEFNLLTGELTGDPARVQEARDAIEIVNKMLKNPGSPYEFAKTPGFELSDVDKLEIAEGTYRAPTITPESETHPPSPSLPFQERPEAEEFREVGGLRREVGVRPTSRIKELFSPARFEVSEDEEEETLSRADDFLRASEVADLPSFEAPEPFEPDLLALFPEPLKVREEEGFALPPRFGAA